MAEANRWRIIEGDCRDVLRQMPAGSVHTVVTSPPYFGLRDYGTEGQIGLEPTPDEFVAALVEVFREVRRVLRDDGTVWLNLGDSYAGGKMGRDDKETLAAIPLARGVGGSMVPSGGVNKGGPAGTSGTARAVPDGYKSKDLLGVPWMVAFALRQPWERHVITSVADRAWMGGLFDGEGCVSVVAVPPTTGLNESHSMRLQVRMADTEAVERIVEITGLSRVTYDQHPPSYVAAGQRPAQQWKISGDTAADILADMYPFLTVKRKQAIVGWNLQRLKDGVVTKRGQPVPAENMAKRRLLHDVLRRLNQRQPVDIPSWCREPTVETEPGWYLRSDVIWSKNNPMPESVTDRPTKAHEYVFLLSKEPRYFYDADAIREADGGWDHPRSVLDGQPSLEPTNGLMAEHKGLRTTEGRNGTGRNKRSVWTVATQPYAGAHFATFPPKLIEPCILAGAPERACGECGAPWVRVVERTAMVVRPTPKRDAWQAEDDHARTQTGGTMLEPPTSRTLGFEPSCSHGDGSARGVVLDPFAGAATTGLVTVQHGREFVGIELNPEYAAMARERIETAVRLGFRAPQNGTAPIEGQVSIFDMNGFA